MFVFFAENNKFEAIKALYGPQNYADFFRSVLKQMPLFPLILSLPSEIIQFLSRSHIAVFLHIENLLGLEWYSLVCLEVCGTQRMVENTVSFLFRGFGLPGETRMLKLLLFSEYIYF